MPLNREAGGGSAAGGLRRRYGARRGPAPACRGGYQHPKPSAACAREDSEVYVVIGIGGSYLGSRAVLEALRGLKIDSPTDSPEIIFAGSPTFSISTV